MEIIVIPIAGAAILAPPLISGLMARSQGRSFWKWFAVGCVLPFIANVILAFLPEKVKHESPEEIINNVS